MPSGSRAAAALLDAGAEGLAQRAIEQAFAGDPVAVRFCLGRVLGARRGQPVVFDVPAVGAPDDVAAAAAAVVAALGAGRLTPDEARAVARLLEGLPRLLAAGGRGSAPAEDPREALKRALARLADREQFWISREADSGAPAAQPQ
ncbi:MAG: hypothetical protein JO032_06390 [Alphaproteobacteria bacterium]|nr:hypothetical protein [Alphaproteobacteria bacterium]